MEECRADGGWTTMERERSRRGQAAAGELEAHGGVALRMEVLQGPAPCAGIPAEGEREVARRGAERTGEIVRHVIGRVGVLQVEAGEEGRAAFVDPPRHLRDRHGV